MRHILRSLFGTALLAAALRAHGAGREVAVTFDDLPDLLAGDDTVAVQSALTERLLSSLARNHVPAIGFVNEEKLENEDGLPDPRRVALVGRWLDAGFALGNHTYSHADLDAVAPAAFEEEILNGERITRPLVSERRSSLVWFRHPYLNTGRTVAVRDEVDAFLGAHGYRVAPVTIDDSEWIYAIADSKAPLWRRPFVRASYIRYMEARFVWAESMSRMVFGREIPQVLLLHASTLNASAFDRLAAMMRRRGYRFITIEQAMKDPAYSAPERWTGGGVGWLERWGTARGIPAARFEGDPHVPLWIQKLAGEKDE